MRFLIAAILLLSFPAHAAVVGNDANAPLTRSAVVSSSSDTFFKLDPLRETVVEVSGTGGGTLKVSTDYTSAPTTFNGFIPDPDGDVSGNTGWRLPRGLSYVGLDVSSGTWTMRVAQPK